MAQVGAIEAAVSRPAALALAPVLLRQGRAARRSIPLLPEAPGARSGLEGVGSSSTAEPVRLLVVGESTAAGVGAGDQRAALPCRLAAEMARRRGAPVAWASSARTGATAAYAFSTLVPAAPAEQDVAVVVLGVNDVLALTAANRWRERVDHLAGDLRQHLTADGLVVLAGVPDLARFGALAQPLRAVLGLHSRVLDDELASIAARHRRVLHVSVPDLVWPQMFSSDRFHPSEDAYRTWAAHLADALDAHASQDT